MLLTLLYHKIGKGNYAQPLSFFEMQFAWIHKHYVTVYPGERLKRKKVICLCFDDGLFDFYLYIFPLLKKYQLKAVLAVSPSFILEKTSLSTRKRLKNREAKNIHDPIAPSSSYCTWTEMQEMQRSKHVHIASHSMSHLPLTSNEVNLQYELLTSKNILEKKLQVPISTFVYPYGKFNAKIHKITKKYYDYVMRIGNGLNFNWKNRNGLIYRVNGDTFSHYKVPFTFHAYCTYFFRTIFNSCRGK